MPGALKTIEAAAFRPLRRPPPSGFVARGAFWCLLSFLVLLLCSLAGFGGHAVLVLRDLAFLALLIFSTILGYRALSARLLWKVRNRLIVTYLLMGFAPLALFGTLATIAAYVFCGQFATYSATSELDAELMRLGGRTNALAAHLARILATGAQPHSLSLPELEDMPGIGSYEQKPHMAVFVENTPIRIANAPVLAEQTGAPSWCHERFQGLVLDHHRLYLRAVMRADAGGHPITVISSSLLTPESLEDFGRGIGNIKVLAEPGLAAEDAIENASESNGRAARTGDARRVSSGQLAELTGGALPPPAHYFDYPVLFTSPLAATDWATGRPVTILLSVTSRPTLLYARLFGTSLQLGVIVRDALITIAVFFAVLELIAFTMALRLSNTITRSVADLYGATRAIDHGHFEYRIQVRRRDQLAALSTSFNSMAASIQKLLIEQREKDRLQSELAIAQEVQNNLFPRESLRLPGLELHGICQPARSVSGDYYDFLLVGSSDLCVAMGDISGKGISAALLMASLHSAVRAYRFAGEELGESHRAFGQDASPLASPGKMLGMLNRHLLRSTQPEKYATLFLAHYSSVDRKLTYSNGGQLPPLVLCANGGMKRLDCGGSVVGLLDGATYEQATVSLEPGDLLVAYSDGVTEPENEFGEFGEEKMVDAILRHRHLPLPAISAQVLLELRAWIGDQEQPDDITLVLARQL